jgi:nicotinamidase/pyrazinamidase
MDNISLGPRVLIVVDMQNDFCRHTGALYVPGTEEIIDPIKNLAMSGEWTLIVFTQDWHPENHSSFDIFPPHCIQNTFGAEIVNELKFKNLPHVTVQKGYFQHADSLSGFFDESGNSTGLYAKLKSIKVSTIDIVGTATEYCVKATVHDAIRCGFKVNVHTNLIKGINQLESEKTLREFQELGVNLLD